MLGLGLGLSLRAQRAAEVVDVVAPNLSAAAASSSVAQQASLSVTTDDATGTLFYVVTKSATQPTADQVIAGQNHLGASAPYAGSQAISSTGLKNATASGLTEAHSSTYWAHFCHRDDAGNKSSVATSAEFAVEIIVNGTANGTTGWAGIGTGSFDATGDVFNVTVAANFDGILQALSGTVPSAGQFDYAFTISNYTSGQIQFVVKQNSGGGGSTVGQVNATANGAYSGSFTLTGNGASMVARNANAGGNFSVDNISLKRHV